MSEEAEIFFGLSIIDYCRVDHQLTGEDIIFCDQSEKLLYTAMKQLMPTVGNISLFLVTANLLTKDFASDRTLYFR